MYKYLIIFSILSFFILPTFVSASTVSAVDNLINTTPYNFFSPWYADQAFVIPEGINNINYLEWQAYNCHGGYTTVTLGLGTSKGDTSLGSCVWTSGINGGNHLIGCAIDMVEVDELETYWFHYVTSSSAHCGAYSNASTLGDTYRYSSLLGTVDWSFKVYTDDTYVPNVCGDGTIGDVEECDEGANNGYLSSSCDLECYTISVPTESAEMSTYGCVQYLSQNKEEDDNNLLYAICGLGSIAIGAFGLKV